MRELIPIEQHEARERGETVGRRQFLRRALQATAGIASLSLVDAPATIAADLFATPSPADQAKVGREAAKQTLQVFREVRDARSRHFESIGRRLVGALSYDDSRPWDFEFRLVNSPEVNALALPGGTIFLHTGFYALLTSDDALAAIVGHEMTHIRQQHWARAYAKTQQRQIVKTFVMGLLHANRDTQSLAGLARSAVSMRYSSRDEVAADAGGLQNLMDAGFKPRGMLDLFTALENAGTTGPALTADFLSDHPLTADRIARIQERVSGSDPTRQIR